MNRYMPLAARRFGLVALQVGLLMSGLLAFAFAPPARGAMLLVPLSGAARAVLPGLAVAHGALLVGQGPLEGSLVVRGDRAALGGVLLREGILALAAPDVLCDSVSKRDR